MGCKPEPSADEKGAAEVTGKRDHPQSRMDYARDRKSLWGPSIAAGNSDVDLPWWLVTLVYPSFRRNVGRHSHLVSLQELFGKRCRAFVLLLENRFHAADVHRLAGGI